MSEQRFTLDEARQKLAETECAAHGHAWEVVEVMTAGPANIICPNCGQTHDIASASRDEEIATRVEMTLRHVEQNKILEVISALREMPTASTSGLITKHDAANYIQAQFS